jgi:glycosyltransferase involved in cell wall biosynthesis
MDPVLRERLGRAARERAEREYSWDAHCEALERALRDAGA